MGEAVTEAPQDLVITGGSSGIGLACVRRYVKAGGRVVVGDLRPPAEDAWIGSAGLVKFVETDVTSIEECQRLVEQAVEFCGRVPDVAVTAAGIAKVARAHADPAAWAGADRPRLFSSKAEVLNLELSVLDRLLDVNLRGTFHVVQAFARVAVEAGSAAAIVTVSSAAASVPLRGGAAYCVSKAGVEMLTKVAALELAGDGIRVNAIAPGYIETPMTAKVRDHETFASEALSSTPMGRFGLADEVADGVVFLGSPRSGYMTGQVLHVSGGQFVG